MGETQIEVDRRLVRKRMQVLSDRLKEIPISRNQRLEDEAQASSLL
jgi:50S ribosomal subunit-associated GTPase HflX